MTNYIIM